MGNNAMYLFKDNVEDSRRTRFRSSVDILDVKHSPRHNELVQVDSILKVQNSPRTKAKDLLHLREHEEDLQKSLIPLMEGDVLIYYQPNGETSKRFMFLNEEGTHLIIRGKQQDVSLCLAAIINVVHGPLTSTFQDFDWIQDKPWLCFSLVFAEGSVDLQCQTREQFQSFFFNFKKFVPTLMSGCSNLRTPRLYWSIAYLKTMQLAKIRNVSITQVWKSLVDESRPTSNNLIEKTDSTLL